MGKKSFRTLIMIITSFTASIGLAACGGSRGKNTMSNVSTTSNPSSSNSTLIASNTSITSNFITSHNPTTDTSTSNVTSSTVLPNSEAHIHSYDQQVVNDTYKASDADCEHAATYYYSCSCGDKSSETFEYGESLRHNWDYEYLQTSEGEYYRNGTCSRCGEKEQITIQSVNNLNFEVINEEEKTCKVTSYKGYYCDERDNYVCIPKTWSGYKVILVENYAFYGCDSLVSITIPDSVTSIGGNVFTYCTSLTSIIIPDSVTSIGEQAFSNCTSLKSITLGKGITRISDNSFDYCTSLTSITIPDNVTSIGGGAFSNCTSLTSVTMGNEIITFETGCFKGCSSLSSITIPDSVTSIENEVFLNCNSLKTITIGKGVESIGYYVFNGCSSLTTIVVNDENTTYDSRNNCNAIIETASNVLITGCASTIIPDSVTKIEDYAFYGCSSLTSIIIPNNVTSIGNGAFYDCSSLNDVYYTGTEEQWKSISVGSSNDPLTSATIHYNYKGE